MEKYLTNNKQKKVTSILFCINIWPCTLSGKLLASPILSIVYQMEVMIYLSEGDMSDKSQHFKVRFISKISLHQMNCKSNITLLFMM